MPTIASALRDSAFRPFRGELCPLLLLKLLHMHLIFRQQHHEHSQNITKQVCSDNGFTRYNAQYSLICLPSILFVVVSIIFMIKCIDCWTNIVNRVDAIPFEIFSFIRNQYICNQIQKYEKACPLRCDINYTGLWTFLLWKMHSLHRPNNWRWCSFRMVWQRIDVRDFEKYFIDSLLNQADSTPGYCERGPDL